MRFWAVFLVLLWPVMGQAQEAAPFITVNPEQIYRQSAFGKAVEAALLVDSRALAQENRQIEQDLEEEELALTEQRAVLPKDEFLPLAEAFNDKVTRLRAEQDEKERAISARVEAQRGKFQAVLPNLYDELLMKTGARALIDGRAVLAAGVGVDQTIAAVAIMDTLLPTP
jgi:Skp family chaperone for outer membrane proteins